MLVGWSNNSQQPLPPHLSKVRLRDLLNCWPVGFSKSRLSDIHTSHQWVWTCLALRSMPCDSCYFTTFMSTSGCHTVTAFQERLSENMRCYPHSGAMSAVCITRRSDQVWLLLLSNVKGQLIVEISSGIWIQTNYFPLISPSSFQQRKEKYST